MVDMLMHQEWSFRLIDFGRSKKRGEWHDAPGSSEEVNVEELFGHRLESDHCNAQ